MAKATTTKAEAGTSEMITRKLRLEGIVPIMFDRYAGDNQTVLEVQQKLYLDAERRVCLPSANIMSFLSAQNTTSAPQRIGVKKYKDICRAALSFLTIEPMLIPFLRDGKEVQFGRFDGDTDKESGIWIHRSVARLPKGIPNPKVRPVLPVPWALEFNLTIFPNEEIQEVQLRNIFVKGGYALGLGTYRGVYGKFKLMGWE
jgi:hypothetical protein